MRETPAGLTSALANRYRVERELGRGGMATAYLAEDLKHQRKVAVKVLRPELAAALGAERFLREITTTANLRHPHILPLYDSGEAGGFLMSKLTFEGKQDIRPVWTADGRSVTFTSDRGRNRDLYTQRADGSAPAVLQLDRAEDILEATWSRDGRWLVVRQSPMPNADLMALQPGVDTAPVPVVATRFGERAPAFSPDGRWLAYASDESGRIEVYVRPFPDADRAKWQVSLTGGSEPRWAHSGREIFYRNAAGALVAVAVTTQPTFSIGRQTELFQGSAFLQDDSHSEYDVAPDDQHFLMLRQRGGGERTDLILVENWFAELRAKAGKPSD